MCEILPAPGPAIHLHLRVDNAEGASTWYFVNGKGATIGRKPSSSVCLKDARVSSEHCKITYNAKSAAWQIVDLDSTGGTILNGVQIAALNGISKRHTLCTGDRVRISNTVLIVTCQPSAPPPVSARTLGDKAVPGILKRVRTSSGTVVSLGQRASKLRFGTHADALRNTEDNAEALMSVPFTEEEIQLWRNALALSQDNFTSMASVIDACRAIQVACFLDDHSLATKSLATNLFSACMFEFPGVSKQESLNLCTERADILNTVFSSSRVHRHAKRLSQGTFESMASFEDARWAVKVARHLNCNSAGVKSLAAKLLDACILDMPGVSRKDAFTLCTESDIIETVFSSKRICDSTQMAQLIQTTYESLGFGHLCDFVSLPLRQELDGSDYSVRKYIEWIHLQSDPGYFSEEHGIRRDARGLAGRADVQEKWADLVASSKGFFVEEASLLEGISESPTLLKLWRKYKFMNSWYFVEPQYCHYVGERSALVAARLKASYAFHIAVLSPIMDAQLSAGPNEGFLLTALSSAQVVQSDGNTSLASKRSSHRPRKQLQPAHRSVRELQDPKLGLVIRGIAYLMNNDMRSLTNLKLVRTGPTHCSLNVLDGVKVER